MKIKIENTELQQCEEFMYLEGVISQDASSRKDLTRRIGITKQEL